MNPLVMKHIQKAIADLEFAQLAMNGVLQRYRQDVPVWAHMALCEVQAALALL